MATKYVDIVVWVVVDEAGTYDCGCDHEQAAERYREDNDHDTGTTGLRQVRIGLKVPLPLPIELDAEVVCDESGTGLTVR